MIDRLIADLDKEMREDRVPGGEDPAGAPRQRGGAIPDQVEGLGLQAQYVGADLPLAEPAVGHCRLPLYAAADLHSGEGARRHVSGTIDERRRRGSVAPTPAQIL